MNKYEKALDRIAFNYGLSALDKQTNEIMDEKFNEDIGVLMELVEKATLKKGVWIADNFGDKTLNCPNCKKPIINVWSKRDYKPHYCHYCGQALDWG